MFFVIRINTGEVKAFETPRQTQIHLLGKSMKDFQIFFAASPVKLKDGDNFRLEQALIEITEK